MQSWCLNNHHRKVVKTSCKTSQSTVFFLQEIADYITSLEIFDECLYSAVGLPLIDQLTE